MHKFVLAGLTILARAGHDPGDWITRLRYGALSATGIRRTVKVSK